MKYYLIAGEASGDLHGSHLMNELKKADKNAEFRFFGGNLMQEQGGVMVRHYREMAFMGFINVLLNIRTIGKNLNFCKKDILEFKPDVIILIDYPGFNLKIASFAKQHGLRVFYYISPKIWAWKEYRIKQIKSFVDEMFTILPFETEFYKKHGIKVNYVGNPLVDYITGFKENAVSKTEFYEKNKFDQRPVVALLSGSRKQEIKKMLPLMKKTAGYFPDFQFVVAGFPAIDKEIYTNLLKDSDIKIVYNQTYDLLNNAYAALVTSGTATLETALFEVPQAVLYRAGGGWLFQFIMKTFFLKIKWVSLPNLILDKDAIKEYIQMDMTFENIKSELEKLLNDENYRNKITTDYKRLKELTGKTGTSKRAAEKMTKLLKTDNFQ